MNQSERDFWEDPTQGQIANPVTDPLGQQCQEFFINKNLSEFQDSYKDFIESQRNHVVKYTLPFKQSEGTRAGCDYAFEFRKGEVTVLAGENGTGKSLLLGQIGMHLMAQGAKLYIASFEMPPVRTIERMLRQSVCSRTCHTISDTDIQNFFSVWANDMKLCDLQGKVTPEQLVKLLISAVNDYHADILCVDSLMMCVSDDMNKVETDFLMSQIIDFARTYNVHVILVAHCRKAGNNQTSFNVFDAASKDSIKGSSNITNIAFNVLVLAKDHQKIQCFYTNKPYDDNKPDFVLNVCKQRNGSFEGYIKLWRDCNSLCFCETRERTPNRSWINVKKETKTVN